jgi:predicted DNA-binding protein
MDPYADIDLDSEAVWLDGAWYTRDELARRIKDMIEQGDFRVSRPSQALERLEAALSQAQLVHVRVPNDLAASLGEAAARLGRPLGHLVREAVAYYLAAAAAYGAAQAAQQQGGAGAPPPPPPAAGPAEPVDLQESEDAFFANAKPR